MKWTLQLSDYFDFTREVATLHWWLLNYCGKGKYFRVKGKNEITIAWPKGYEFGERAKNAVSRGFGWPSFPQCR